MEDRGDPNRRQVKGSIAKTILSYVRRVQGEGDVARVLELAGQRTGTTGLLEPASWTSHETTVTIAEVAGEVCGDHDIGRRAGEELMRLQRERGTADFVRSTGSVGAALELVANVSTKMSQGRLHEVTDLGDGDATLTAVYRNLATADPFYCGYFEGYLAAVPELFGYSGVASEPTCMSRGDDACTFQVRWSAIGSATPAVGAADIEGSRQRVDSIIARFEELHGMATELAGADDVDTLLARITDRAGVAVDAPRNLLAVRTNDDGRLHLHHRGFEPDAADRLAAKLLDDELEENERTLVAEVASPHRTYGRLVALYPEGSTVTDVERRLLAAYARHAAAALEALTALETARRDHDTAQALLSLADALSKVGSKSDVARRLAAAVPSVVSCRRAQVWLWDPTEECLRLEEQFPVRPVRGQVAVLHARSTPRLAAMAHDPAPMIFDRHEAGPGLRELLPLDGPQHWAVVPIQARGRFLGVVGVGLVDAPGPEGRSGHERDLLERLGGLTDQAATALDNAELLEVTRAQALTDSLTDLPNRKLFEDRVHTALAQADRAESGLTLLFVDLDHFKKINDTLGHEAGDEAIRQAAARLQACVRASDTVARLGGDEFVLLLPGLEEPEAVGRLVDQILAAFVPPFDLCGREVVLNCSIGVASSPRDGCDYASLLRHADAAMYRAKQAGGASASTTSADASAPATGASPATAQRTHRLELESRLRTAIDQGELTVLYQPQIDLRTWQIEAVEALVRWDHPELGRLEPSEFVPLAEQSGLVVALDRWVRTTALRQARAWLDAGLRLRMAVNLSDRTLRDPGLPGEIGDLLARLELPADMVELEVTERVLLDDRDLRTVLAPLADLGVRLAIDDFGTGSAVLARLGQLRLHTLKLDRSLVDTITSFSSDSPVVTGVLAMAAGLGMDVVAEGVETLAQQEALRRSGTCHLAQGFLFSRPVEAVDIWASCVSRPAAAGPAAELA